MKWKRVASKFDKDTVRYELEGTGLFVAPYFAFMIGSNDSGGFRRTGYEVMRKTKAGAESLKPSKVYHTVGMAKKAAERIAAE